MKIYIASSFGNVEYVRHLHDYLVGRGHTITCRWWLCDYKTALGDIGDDEWYGRPIIKTIYQRSFKAIENADMLILVSPNQRAFNGANIEVGIALGLGKTVVSYGVTERSGMYEPLIRCKNLVELDKALTEFEER